MKGNTFCFFMFFSLLLLGCDKKVDQELKSTNTRLVSEDFKTTEERVDVLKKHITVYSEFKEAQFDIFNVNGNFNEERLSVPGATSYDYQFVVVVDSSDVDKWIKGMVKDSLPKNLNSMNWLLGLNKRLKHEIAINESFECYKRKGENNYAFVNREKGILFRRLVNL